MRLPALLPSLYCLFAFQCGSLQAYKHHGHGSGSRLPTAIIDSGKIIGTTTAVPSATAVVNQFLGVPFASPPKRFEAPQPPSRSYRPLKTQSFQPACVQQFNYQGAARVFVMTVFNSDMPEESEDCLYLNVYAPSTPPPRGGRAVMFWIFGGALQFGTGGQSAYDGSYFAAYEDVVVVTINYRTNGKRPRLVANRSLLTAHPVFGFPASPELSPKGHNLGFLDQRLALQWVQRNIRRFGGDPDKVLIFGESAGGVSVDALLTSFPKGSKPPFRAAILESGQISYRPGRNATTSSIPAWNQLVTLLNCTGVQNLSCVSSKPATTIKSIIEENALVFNPVPDNHTLYSDPAGRRARREIAVIPTLSGTNSQEGRVFQYGQGNTTAFVQATFPRLSAERRRQIIAAYPLGASPGTGDEFGQLSQIYTDYAFQCPEALYANETAASGIPTWRYYYNATFPNIQVFPNLGVYHASEIPLVFRSFNKTTATAQQNVLSGLVQAAWARFAKHPELGPGWNRVGTGGRYAGGAPDLDVAVVQPAGFEVQRQRVLDARCGLYADLLAGQ